MTTSPEKWENSQEAAAAATTTKGVTSYDAEEAAVGDDNGLILGERYLPEELITNILCYVDHKSLLNAQLVCRRWKMLMETYVWRKKAECTIGRSLQSLKNVTWDVHYAICKRAFEKNLLKNNSGQYGVEKCWEILKSGGDGWVVECPARGVPPFPGTNRDTDTPAPSARKQHCFATSYYTCSKRQTIDLASEGLTSHLLDTFQPPIVVSEWYSCRWDCPALYECCVKLLGAGDKVLDKFEFRVSIEGEAQNAWHYVSHEFTNYGPGLEKIMFYHGGTDILVWAGNYGSKMADGSVRVKLFNEPDPLPTLSPDTVEPQLLPVKTRLLEEYRYLRRRSNMLRRWDRNHPRPADEDDDR